LGQGTLEMVRRVLEKCYISSESDWEVRNKVENVSVSLYYIGEYSKP
jgi:hypothetical protein